MEFWQLFFERKKTGAGDYIDVAMLDGAISLQPLLMASMQALGKTPDRGGDFLSGGTPCYQVYSTKDNRFMALGSIEKKFWVNFCQAAECEELIPAHMSMGEAGKELHKQVCEIFQAKTQAEWIEIFATVDACCTPVLTIEEALANEQVHARGLVIETKDPIEGAYKQFAMPIKFQSFTPEIQSPAPKLGQHNSDYLTD